MQVDESETENSFDELFSVGRFLLTLSLLIFVLYPGLVLGTRAFSNRDAGLFSYPVAYYLRDSLRHGQLPLWNPYNHCGTPFLAQWNTMVLYPFSLFYVLLPMPWSLNVFLLGHLLLGGAGMYRLAHDWFGKRFAASVAGLAFAWNGMSIHCLMWPCHTAGLAWMPWVVWNCDRAAREGGRRIYWAALAGACQMLTGSPETILLTWLIAAGAFVWGVLQTPQGLWTRGRRMLGLATFIAALSAAQLFPTLDLLAHGDRTSSTGNGFWALSPWGLANFVVPLFHTFPSLSGVFMQDEQQWTSSYYIGVLPLALAAVALWKARGGRTLLLAALALGGILLALADAGFVLNLLKRVVPLLGFIRFPIKFIILTLFCLALLAGAGTAWLQSQLPTVAARSLSWAGMWIGLAVLLVLAVARWLPFPSDSWSVVWPNALVRLAFLLIGLGLFTLIFRAQALRSRILLSFGFLLWMGLDISTHVPAQNPTVSARAYDAFPPPMTQLPRIGVSRAMLSPEAQRTMDHLGNPDPLTLYLGQRAELLSDCNLLEKIPIVGGFMTLRIAAMDNVAGLLLTGKASPGLEQFLGVSQIASPRKLFAWEPQTNFMPWATAGQKPVFLDDAATLSVLCSNQFSPHQEVYFSAGARGQIKAEADSQARIISGQFDPSQCVIEASANKRAMLVVAQSYYHCWQASVDGASVPLWRVNHAFQALEIPAGRHKVRIVYLDLPFRIGAVISVLALTGCAAGLLARTKP